MSQKNKHPIHKTFAGSIELSPTQPLFVEFIDGPRLWGFPIKQLKKFLLKDNPPHPDKRTSPPQELLLVYPEALVFLRGWRLEMMVSPLVTGRIARVHAEKHLGSLILDDAWVSEIRVVTLNPDQGEKVAAPALIKRP